VEVLGDVAFRSYPLSEKDVLNMINETKSSHLLAGVRGEKKKDIIAVVEIILKLGAILWKYPAISDIEINPLIVYEEGGGAIAPDVRIILSKEEQVE
jgi:acyl-CoA synthetase (NDP forming)